jgi:hypothetical protein
VTRALTTALVVALTGLCAIFARAAHGQADTATILVRACVAEADFSAQDCAAILHTLDRRSRRAGIAIADHAVDYVSAFRVRPTDRLRWVMQIEPTCRKPEAWPADLAWERYAPKCTAAFAMVNAFLAGELDDPCNGRSWHWGSPHLPSDVERAARARWRVVRCGETCNAFYSERTTDAVEAKGTK